MKLNLNNNELVALLECIDTAIDYIDDKMVLASLKSLANKINGEVTIFNRQPEEKVIILLEQLKEIEELEVEN